jgi:hypothetical protein
MRRSSQLLSDETTNLFSRVPKEKLAMADYDRNCTRIHKRSLNGEIFCPRLLFLVASMYFQFGQLRTFSWLMFR